MNVLLEMRTIELPLALEYKRTEVIGAYQIPSQVSREQAFSCSSRRHDSLALDLQFERSYDIIVQKAKHFNKGCAISR
jgi:hypothetical protein